MLAINAIVKYKALFYLKTRFTISLSFGWQQTVQDLPIFRLPSVVMGAEYFNMLMAVFGFYLPYLKKVMQTPSFS